MSRADTAAIFYHILEVDGRDETINVPEHEPYLAHAQSKAGLPIDYNVVYNTKYDPSTICTGPSHNICANPQLAGFETTGYNARPLIIDFFGNTRMTNGIDIGAIEVQ